MLTGHIPNQVDLAREAGRGSSPRNDVRILPALSSRHTYKNKRPRTRARA
jgi:hypothetical protein